MPVSVSYPGVYIEEIPSGVRTIVGVPTSVTAFVGYTRRGSTNEATPIFSFSDFERSFGGLHPDSEVSYAVQHFFLNGGSKALIVRVAAGAAAAAVNLRNGVGGGAIVVLTVTAESEGVWGNLLRVDVDYDTVNPDSLFNLSVTELEERNGVLQPARSEVHRNLSMSSFSSAYAVNVVNAASNLVRLERLAGAAAAIANNNATSTSGRLSDADLNQLNDDHRRLAITLDGDGPHEFDIFDPGGVLAGATLNDRLNDLAGRITARVTTTINPSVLAFHDFICARSGETIVCTSGTPNGQGERSSVRFTNASQRSATAILRLATTNGGHEVDGAAAVRPAQTGTMGTGLSALDFNTLVQPANIRVTLQAAGMADDGPLTLALWATGGRPATLQQLADRLATALAASPRAELSGAQVSVGTALRVVAGGTNPNMRLHFTNDGADTTATNIGLAGGTENVAHYAPGVGLTAQAQADPVPGNDGTPPLPNDLRGNRAVKTGLFALEDADIFNILTIPDQSDPALLAQALAYAAERRAMLIVDMPETVDTFAEARTWLQQLQQNGITRHRNAAVYFPRVRAADPLDGNRLRSFANCGAVAGLYSRIDATRGVWKAPAGTEATLLGVQALDYTLSDPENGVLNPLALNCIRNFPAFGPVVWGARTLEGSDQLASEYKYIPVRRLALFLEETLYRATQWVVFEPNDEPLWAQIRLNVGAFMNTMFRQGAFQGKTPREAYLVKCDSETTTQNDINLGIVNIVVGFAPLKPAEFVIIKIQQLAGQIQV